MIHLLNENASLYITPTSDKVKINKTKNHEGSASEEQYTISYGGKSNIPIEEELRRLLGYDTWEEYKRDNFEDLTKKNPTVHPFHVAYALEGFLKKIKPMDYELVAVPNSSILGNRVTLEEVTLVNVVHGLRKGFFGSGTGQDGVLSVAMYSPQEGLANISVIDKIKETIKVSETILDVFSAARFVKHPEGKYWRRDFESPFLTNSRREALIVKPVDVVQDPAVLYESNTRTKRARINNALTFLDFKQMIFERVESPAVGINHLNFFLLPSGWRKGVAFTNAEIELAKKIGANYSSGIMIDPSGETTLLDLKTPTKTSRPRGANIRSLSDANILIFGHSQATQIGESLTKKAKDAGAKITKIVKAGFADGHSKKGLVHILDEIPNKNFSYAYLFLGGNTGARGPDYEQAKVKIINHMTDVLGVPKNNIIVVLPPINMDNEYSKSRRALNRRAESFFKTLGVGVHPQIVGRAGDFLTDGFHIKSGGKLINGVTDSMLGAFVASKHSTPGVDDTGISVPYAFVQENLGIDKRAWDVFRKEVGFIESANQYHIKGGAGKHYDGRYQIGAIAKTGGSARFGIPDPGHSPEQRKAFRANPNLQEKILAGLTVGNDRILRSKNRKYKAIEDPLERLKILAIAHQGWTSASKYLNTGASGEDKWGTKGTKYYDAVQRALQLNREQPSPRKDIPAASSLAAAAKASNIKYFGTESGISHGKKKSTANDKGSYNYSLNYTVGAVPFTGTHTSPNVSDKWEIENLSFADVPVPNFYGGRPPKVHKNLVASLEGAVNESREKFGLPLMHVGGFAQKGSCRSGCRLSSHAWGGAVDFDSPVGPMTPHGLLSLNNVSDALENKNGWYERYWNFRNPRTGQSYLDHLKESFQNKKRALPLYVFVAGRSPNNGIANIFAKYGWRWGGDWNQTSKDTMHFEYLPDKIRRA